MNAFTSKVGWAVAALTTITLVASWAGIINAGPLDPPGEPSSTMKSLDEIPGSWSRILSSTGADACATARFDCVLVNDEAVLDRETGLVWDRQPSESTMDWDSAIRACHDRDRGGRLGWRLPSVSETLSLLDTQSVDGLPDGHPFTLPAATDKFWTSTRNTASDTRSMRIDVSDALVADELRDAANGFWCVRGSSGDDTQ